MNCPNCDGIGRIVTIDKPCHECEATGWLEDTVEGFMCALRGGQWWVQDVFPYFRHYIAFIDIEKWVLLTDPRIQGSMAWSVENEDGTYNQVHTTKELATYLHKHKYSYRGNLAKNISEWNEHLYHVDPATGKSTYHAHYI